MTSQSLEPIDKAKMLIARAVVDGDVDSLAELRQRASAYELYHQRAGARDMANEAGEIKVRAERGLGAVDQTERPHGGDRYQDSPAESWSVKVAPATRAAWRKLGKLSAQDFEDRIRRARADENTGVSTKAVLAAAGPENFSSASDEWYTPAEHAEAARRVLGGIDLDPASSAAANETIKAATFWTREDDGLGREWFGRVFLNPPFGLSSAFVPKLLAEYESDRVDAAILVLNGNRFDARWFHPLWDHTLCFTYTRPAFTNPYMTYEARPTGGTAFVYLGLAPKRFDEEFARFGAVVQRCAW